MLIKPRHQFDVFLGWFMNQQLCPIVLYKFFLKEISEKQKKNDFIVRVYEHWKHIQQSTHSD